MNLSELNKVFNINGVVYIEVFYAESEGDNENDVFISGAVGSFCITTLQKIEEEMLMLVEFDKGDGLYWFKCTYTSPTYCPESFGLVEGDYWEFEPINHVTFEEIEELYADSVINPNI